MSRGGSYGGGQSSLGYLFGGSDDKKKQEESKSPRPPPSPKFFTPPPYGIDTNTDNPPKIPIYSPPKEKNVSNNYQRAEGQNSGNFITGRPSTKVNSVPGGDSSLGYLFGDK